jgi:glycosyltransferase involved in cell wall biosynthesis
LKKLAILSTHPIQYNAPFFRQLARSEKIRLKVFYTWDRSQSPYDRGFGQEIRWDTPLLEGYESCFVKNTSRHPGSHHFRGIKNPGLIAEIESWNPDILLVYGWAFQSHLQVLRHFKGKIPVWFRGDSILLDYPLQSFQALINHCFYRKKSKSVRQSIPASIRSYFTFRLRSLFLGWVYTFVDKAFYVGLENRKYFLHHGMKEEQLVWMPHAVDNDFFMKGHEQKEKEALEWRRSLGIPDEALVLLYAAKMVASKHPHILLRAFLDLAPHTPPARHSEYGGGEPGTRNPKPGTLNPEPVTHLLFVGSGPLEHELKSKSADHPQIHFLPFQNQSKMPLVYRMGDLYCLPSRGPETWGLAVNEALASGRPVLVSDRVGCAGDLVKSGITGEIFTTGNVQDLKEKILFILNNKNTYQPRRLQDYISQYSFTQDVEAIESML